MKLLTILFFCITLPTSLFADTYAVCKAEEQIYSIKFTNNKIYINQNNTGFKDWSNYIQGISKEEVILKYNWEKKPLKLSENCNLEDFTFIRGFSDEVVEKLVFNCPTTKLKPLDTLIRWDTYIEEVQKAYDDMPPSYEYIRINRVSGEMKYHRMRHQLTPRDEGHVKGRRVGLTGTVMERNNFICEATNKTLF